SVNVSPRHFRQAHFASWFKGLLVATGADPHNLTLEITESLFLDNLNAVVAKMIELAALGIHFSIDDFGTGYSSLAYLKRLPIHELKIDKTFVQDAPNDPNDAALVEAILAVATHLRLRVVAEGVETEEQARFLNARATVIHQGYLYGKPKPAPTWLARWKTAACDTNNACPAELTASHDTPPCRIAMEQSNAETL
ncbi:MAG TPA: EAL domain-containing protein, partial [Candidatus Competibacteraceae bacterium]|nr:EAL domain-containing protein [Candidatus Competibacteraceae bacterium]